MQKVFKIFFCFFLFAISFSCKKKIDSYSASNADLKGNVTLYVHVVHHTYSLSNIAVYLKKGATLYPGNDVSSYEYKVVSDANGIAEFDQLPIDADVWVYGFGTDNYISRSVTGNTGIKLSQAFVGTDNKADLTLYVSE